MTEPRNTLGVVCAAVVLMAATEASDAHGQSAQERARYFRNGADATSVPNAGQPGADFFRRGAEATSVPTTGQPGGDYFFNGAQSNGADVTSVPRTDQPGSEFFRRGADTTSVYRAGQGSGDEHFSRGADVTSVPRAGQPGAEHFSRGADVTSVPRAGQPGAEHFSRGADVTSVPAGRVQDLDDGLVIVEPTPEAEPAQDTPSEAVVEPAEVPSTEEGDDTETDPESADGVEASPLAAVSDGIVSLLPAWPTFVDPSPTADDHTVDDHETDDHDATELAEEAALSDAASQDNAAEHPSVFERVEASVNRVAVGVRVLVIALAVLFSILAVAAWRALIQRRDPDASEERER